MREIKWAKKLITNTSGQGVAYGAEEMGYIFYHRKHERLNETHPKGGFSSKINKKLYLKPALERAHTARHSHHPKAKLKI